jgi:hypothetical protein
MVRRAALVPFFGFALLILSPLPAQVGVRPTQPEAPPSAAPAPVLPEVRLEHRFIQVEPLRPEKSSPRIRRGPASTRLAAAVADGRDTVVGRARRAFLGDGRFRPEPFPRLDR